MITLPPFSKEQLIYYTYLQALMINVIQTYFLSFIFITLINDKTVTIFQKATHLLYLFTCINDKCYINLSFKFYTISVPICLSCLKSQTF